MSIFEFFFKYKPIIYAKGRVAFQLLGWRGLVALRAVTFAVLAFIFLRPVLNISTVLPQDSYLAVVIDNSESMNIRDDGKETRGEQLQKQFESTNFFKKLNDKFRVRTYRFDKEAERIEK